MPDDPEPDPAPEPTPDPTPEPEQTPETGATQAEVDKAYAKLREAEKARKVAEEKLAEQARQKAEEEGRFKEIAEQEKARADRLEAEQEQAEQRRNAERSARDMKFKDGDYALYLLAQQGVDFADPVQVREGLEGLAKDRADLIAGHVPPPSGGPAGGAKATPPSLTRADLEGMTPRQIANLDPKVVEEAQAAAQ